MRALSLFSGIGLHDLGLQLAGFEIAAQCEIDPWCLAVLERHFPAAVRFDDVRTLTGRVVGPVDLITGGFPCQDVSVAGKGAGLEGARSGLWHEMRRIVLEVRPRWLLIENVPALRLRGADAVLPALEELGYACWPCVVGAWAIGAPHKRDRVWIVAHADRDARRRIAQHSGLEGAPGDLADGRGDGGRWNRTRRGVEEGAGLADSDESNRGRRTDLTQRGPEGREVAGWNGGGTRWPARPGERQHEWEAPRLVKPNLPGRRDAGEGDAGSGIEGTRTGEDSTSRGDGGSAGLADSYRTREREHGREFRGPQCGSGSALSSLPDGTSEREVGQSRLSQPRLGGATDGRARRLDSFARRNRLKALGNANPWQVPYLIGCWIIEQERGE